MIRSFRRRRTSSLSTTTSSLSSVLDHVHHGEQVILATVNLLPDELVRVRCRPGVAASPADKRLSILGIVSRDAALGVFGEEGVEGYNFGLAVNRGQGVDIP